MSEEGFTTLYEIFPLALEGRQTRAWGEWNNEERGGVLRFPLFLHFRFFPFPTFRSFLYERASADERDTKLYFAIYGHQKNTARVICEFKQHHKWAYKVL